MIAPTPAFTAALERHELHAVEPRARRRRTTGSARCEFVPVSPCPGKCFPVAIIPCSCTPRMNAAPSRATSAGSSPKERVLITGFAGLLFTSRIGEKSMWNAERAPLDRRDASLLVRERRVARGADRHLGREDDGAAEVDAVGQEISAARAISGAELEVARPRAAADRSCAAARSASPRSRAASPPT